MHGFKGLLTGCALDLANDELLLIGVEVDAGRYSAHRVWVVGLRRSSFRLGITGFPGRKRFLAGVQREGSSWPRLRLPIWGDGLEFGSIAAEEGEGDHE